MSFINVAFGYLQQLVGIVPPVTSYDNYSWGNSSDYQTAQGTTTDIQRPKLVSGGTYIGGSMGSLFSILIKNDGTMWSVGDSANYKTGQGNLTDLSTLTQIGSDDTWSAIDCGQEHSIALKSDGTIWSWGVNTKGQCGQGSTTAIQIPTQIGTDSDWVEVGCNYLASMARKSDGTIYTWGSGDNSFYTTGQATTSNLLVPTKLGTDTDWTQISAGVYTSFAMKSNDELWGWGYNGSYCLGDGTTTVSQVPKQLGGGTSDWASIDTHFFDGFGIKLNGELYSWGHNGSGQGGVGTTTATQNPTQVGSDTDWEQVSGSFSYTLGIKNSGELWSCGSNSEYQTGIGTSAGNQTTFTRVDNETNWVKVLHGTWTQNGFAFKTIETLPVTGATAWYGNLVNNGYNRTSLADSAAITQWTDLSGYGNDASANGSPIYDSTEDAIEFDGSTDYFLLDTVLNARNATGSTLFIVSKIISDGSTFYNLFSNQGDSGNNSQIRFNTTIQGALGGSEADLRPNTVNTIDGNAKKGIITLRVDTPNEIASLWWNGANTGTTATPSTGTTTAFKLDGIGVRYNLTDYFKGFMNEIIYYQRPLSDSEKAQVEEYLNNKYTLY